MKTSGSGPDFRYQFRISIFFHDVFRFLVAAQHVEQRLEIGRLCHRRSGSSAAFVALPVSAPSAASLLLLFLCCGDKDAEDASNNFRITLKDAQLLDVRLWHD